MSKLHPEMTIGQIVAEFPRTAPVFETYGIDYCCGGKVTLNFHFAKGKLDPQAVLAALEAAVAAPAEPTTNWAEAPLPELVAHILDTHHAYLEAAMPRLSRLANKVARVHGDHHPELRELARVYAGFAEEMTTHMRKEESILFPAILRLCAGAGDFPVDRPIHVMEAEHEAAGADLARMRELTGDYTPPEDACGSYRALFAGLAELETDTFRHVHKENSILFPRAIALLTPAAAR